MSVSALRYWRESASLLLVGKAAAAVATSTPTTVTSKENRNANTPNYKILMLKRSSRMSFFPNFYVFPGGAADDADFSSEWLDILGPSFSSTTGPYSPRESLFRLFSRETKDNKRAPILSRKRDPKYSVIPSDIAFRICAIRETFEETGILLAYKAKSDATLEQNNNPNNGEESYLEVPRRCTAKLCDLPAEQLNEWRQCILQKPDNFLKMCREFNLIPDLTALSEWANWLTPISTNNGRSKKRFDTIFFITFVDYLPNVLIEEHESANHMWQAPNEYFTHLAEGSIYLGPPQIYELNYMNFHSWDTFHDDVEQHPHFHASRWMPVPVKCKDGSLYLFPGDDKYPKDVNFEVDTGTIEFPVTKQEFNDSNQWNHHYDPKGFVMQRNLPFSSLRAQPLKDSVLSLLLKSKL